MPLWELVHPCTEYHLHIEHLLSTDQTNNSSIVSKRSVERLYFPDEPHFFRYFVKKPQRRSPLINRGYWLRMKAIDHVVRQFLEQPAKFPKVVVNLGCGYDPLAWQCLSRYPGLCENVSFVDIDYKELMLRKRDMVNRTPELKHVLTNVEMLEGDILLRSDQYLQIGCDLRDLGSLDKALASAINVKNCQILFVAEVSITYMDANYADDLIEWASKLRGKLFADEIVPSKADNTPARFCLLEQLLPEGINHPFARTMMAHFEKLKTPLKAVKKYPTTSAQQQRFQARGWQDVSARNLWELWGSPEFLGPEERKALGAIEPFDEWEEFALFGCHYVLLVANIFIADTIEKQPETEIPVVVSISSLQMEVKFSESPKGCGYRRFAAGLPLKGNRALARVGNFAGAGLETRIDSCDVYATATDNLQDAPQPDTRNSQSYPSKRQCHTITDLGDAGALLCGKFLFSHFMRSQC
jgi:tRNA wybutosine-synthesizing protein 4